MKMRSLILAAVAIVALSASAAAQNVTKYVRYQAGNTTSYGILEGDTIRELQGSIFENAKPTGRTRKLAEVKLLAPVEPKKVIAAGLNYKSHIGEQPAAKYVGLFAKLPTSIIGHEENIIYPADATDLHYEAEICRRHRQARQQHHRSAGAAAHLRRHRRQRRERARVAEAGHAVVPREGVRHLRPDGPGARDRPRLQQPEPDRPPQRQGGPGDEHQAADLLDPQHRQLREPIRHARTGRRDLHGHAGRRPRR